MSNFFYRHWFVLGLIGTLLVGVTWSEELLWFAELKAVRNMVVMVVMFCTTLPVNFAMIRRTVVRPWPALLSTAISLVFVPLLAWPLSKLLSGELSLGILVLAVTPGTLATSAVWTRRAGGNDVVPIMVTLTTNLSCFVVSPLWLMLMTRGSTGIQLSLGETMVKLFLLVVLPMVLAQCVRLNSTVARWANDRKRLLSTLSQCGILAIVLVGAIQCGVRLRAEAWSPGQQTFQFGIMLAIVCGIHVVALVSGWHASRLLRFARPETIGVAFSGSQKTLMVGLQLALMAGGGLAILPLCTYHFFQLVLDAFVADVWREGAPAGGPPAGGKTRTS